MKFILFIGFILAQIEITIERDKPEITEEENIPETTKEKYKSITTDKDIALLMYISPA